MQDRIRYLCCALAFAVAPILRADPVTLTMATGRTIEGDITEWSSNKIVVTSDGQTHTLSPKELLTIQVDSARNAKMRNDSPSWIELADGSRIPFLEFTLLDRTATIQSSLTDAAIMLRSEQIRSVQLTAAGRNAVDVTPPNQAGDFLVITKKDSDETEMLFGVIGDVTSEQVEFTWEGDTIPVKLSKIAAIGFHQSEGVEQPEAICVLSLTSGASLQVRTIDVQSGSFDVQTTGGLKLKIPVAEVAAADYSAGKLAYLSEMEPLKSRWTPLISLPAAASTIKDYGAPRRDVAFTGSPLTLSRQAENGNDKKIQSFNKGLALRSRTEMEYRIPKDMRRFVAIAGIDPDTEEQGSVLLTIEVDGETAFEQVIDGRQPPVDIEVDIANRKRLKILVDYGENLDTGDRLHLVEARLIK